MRDLKHLYYFENLLQEAHNELVKQACDEGRIALGYTCYHIPEVLLNLDKCFSVRLRAPRTGSTDIATYYLSNFLCGYCKAILERGIEGGYNFLGALIGGETCSEMNRAIEHFEILDLNKNKNFFLSIIDMPFKTDEHCIQAYMKQLKLKVLNKLKENYDVDVSDDAIRKAVKEHNEVCRIIKEIGEFRKDEYPKITGYEYAVLNLVSYTCPKNLIVDKLRETLEEIKTREPDSKKFYRARIAVVGSEMDDPGFIKLFEDCGAYVVADRFCYGSTPGREEIELKDDEDPLYTICKHYMKTSQCPRYMEHEKVQGRKQFVADLVKEYKADGVIYEQIKFCEFWGYERALASHIMINDYGIPAIAIDREYTSTASGQLKTRTQAFVESLEIKKIQKNMKMEGK